MGSLDIDTPRKQSQNQSSIMSKLKIFLLIVASNLLTIYLLAATDFALDLNSFTGSSSRVSRSESLLLRELNDTKHQLAAHEIKNADLRRLLADANNLLVALISDLDKARAKNSPPEHLGGWLHELSGELKLAAGPHKLPFGYTPNFGSDEIYPALGSSCRRYQDELIKYMSYQIGGECPADDNFAQQLMLKGCEPLPRRRCHPKSPVGYVEPTPFPASMWTIPADTSITWDSYTCKNYQCLVNRKNDKGSYDCKDCFDLGGREKVRWLHESSDLDYAIDTVLALKPAGTIRIGLDIGGGSGTFAARMRERDITIVTSSMNFDGPFNSFIAARGLVPMHFSVANRLPFFDGTLDIVHSMHVLSNWIPDVMLEFALYDIYRILRPGGVFWLDHFFCVGTQLNATYVPMFDRIGFKKIRWNTGRKMDRGIEMDEWYLSALLEKPMS